MTSHRSSALPYRFAFRLLALVAIGMPIAVALDEIFTLDGQSIACREFVGFGAEWDPKFWDDYNIKQGADEAAWKVIVKRLEWMRPPWVRMMILARWYTTGDGTYDWDTPAMRGIYRHLDVCQRLGIKVTLTDWGVESWAKVAGFPGNDDPKYIAAVVAAVEQLINGRHYSVIDRVVLVNEPNFETSWERWASGVKQLAAAVRERQLPVVLAGTDSAQDDAWHRRGVDEVASCFGAWDIHRYHPSADLKAGSIEALVAPMWAYVRAHDPDSANKPLLICEGGISDGMSAANSPHIDEYEYGVWMADYAAQAIRAGSQGVSAWMLDDSSHEGFTWGMWKNVAGKQALKPWFYPWSLLCRTIRPGATLYRVTSSDPHVRVLVAEGRTGERAHWTFMVVNQSDALYRLGLRVPDGGQARVARYLYAREGRKVDGDGFPLPISHDAVDLGKGLTIECPAMSVAFAVDER